MDAQSGLVHSVVGRATKLSNINVAGSLLHSEKHAAFGDAGYQRVHKRVELTRNDARRQTAKIQ